MHVYISLQLRSSFAFSDLFMKLRDTMELLNYLKSSEGKHCGTTCVCVSFLVSLPDYWHYA